MAHAGTPLVLKHSWTTDTLDTGEIHDELGKLWQELQLAAPRLNEQHSDTSDPQHIASGVMRASTLNLLVIVSDDEEARIACDTIARLRDFLPTRTIILIMREHAEDENASYDISVELLDQQTATGDRTESQLRFETITIGIPLQDSGQVPSLVEPLFIPELEDFLWWPGANHNNYQLYEDLLGLVDRVIVDTAQFVRDTREQGDFRQLVDARDGVLVLGDFTWERLAPWRSLLAQFFDPPDTQASLDTIEQVTIHYAYNRAEGGSGAPAAFLIVGWLASRLGWEIIDPLTRRKDGNYWAPLRAHSGDKGREIVLRIVPDLSQHAKFSLRSVELVAGGESPGTFKVERTDSDDLMTSSETPTNPFVSRMVFSRRPDPVNMLGEELRRFSRDVIYEEAAEFAVQLMDAPRN
jgi:glucose-6-phosphate dehydrogenase assembly protein OpcA